MKVLNAICDTWNVLEKYDVEYEKINDNMIAISNADYERILANSQNKNYIKRLHNTSEFAKNYEASH